MDQLQQPDWHHAELDRRISTWLHDHRLRGGHIHCRRGCGGCCNLVVNATLPEAAFIAAALDQPRRDRLAVYITRLKQHLPAAADLKSFLKIHRQLIGFCPFLDAEENCGIYPFRPLSCRALLSTRPAAWCTVDFSTLHELERAAFIASLDREVVAFPSHYVAATQQAARNLENDLLSGMAARCGFSLGGHLPTLVWLELEAGLSRNLHRGAEGLAEEAQAAGLAAPYLLDFQTLPQGAD